MRFGTFSAVRGVVGDAVTGGAPAWLWRGPGFVAALLLGVLGCHLLRSWVLDWYLVPSASMEPLLHGDPVDGDLVLVDKTAYRSAEPARFDVVVVRDPHDPDGHLVKRLVARGDDADRVVRILEGDLFVGPTRQSLRRLVKDPRDARRLRVPHFAFPGDGPEPPEETAVASIDVES